MRPLFCEITSWWNWYYIKNQISPHFFYYPTQLMIKKGFNVEVLTMLYSDREEIEYENCGKLKIFRFMKKNSPFLSFNLFNYMSKKDYSLIHLHNIDWPLDYIPWMVHLIKNTPMVYTSHDPYMLDIIVSRKLTRDYLINWIHSKGFKVMNSKTCIFIAFTKCQAEAYKKLGIKNVRVIPHGIDPTIFRIKLNRHIIQKYGLDEFNIFCVGNFEPRKGQHLLINSMKEVLKEYPHTRLIMVGRAFAQYQKEYLDILRSEIRKNDLNDKVEIIFDASRNDVVQLYLSSTLFALPTQTEMFGLVLLEAMAAGLPIISTDKPYIKEILNNGEAGILVRREQKLIENAILRLLGDSTLRRRLGNNAKKTVEQKYRLDKVVQQHWNLYQSLLDQDT